MAQFSHGKTVVCSVCSKNLLHYEKRLLQKALFFRYCSSGLFKNFLKLSRKHLYRSLYWWSCWLPACNFFGKDNPIQVFSCKFYQIFKNTYFIESLGVTASESSSQTVSLHIIIKTCKWHQLRTTLLTLKMFFVCGDNFGNRHPE